LASPTLAPALPASPTRPRPALASAGVGLSLVAVLGLAPLLLERGPVDFLPPYASPALGVAARAGVLLLLLFAVGVRARADEREETGGGRVTLLLAVLAVGFTAWHWLAVDRHPAAEAWQRGRYLSVLGHEAGTPEMDIPHVFRPLPYGFTRLLEWLTGDWEFACLAYRWFFSFWFVWAAYRLARRFHPPGRALLALAPVALLYPLSVRYYSGQLTDPLSHALFVLGFLYILDDRPGPLAGALALGVLAKETAVLLVPGYFACNWRRWRGWLVAAGLGAACTAAYLAARLPLGWRPGYRQINGTEESMVWANLGIGPRVGWVTAPLYEGYLQPLLFLGLFLVPILCRWREVDRRLRLLCLTVPPLVLLSSLQFSWLHESRNYLPLVPLLAAAALPAQPRSDRQSVGA
jgi:hypothetical protein